MAIKMKTTCDTHRKDALFEEIEEIFISMLNWPRGSHSLFAPRGIVSSSIL